MGDEGWGGGAGVVFGRASRMEMTEAFMPEPWEGVPPAFAAALTDLYLGMPGKGKER